MRGHIHRLIAILIACCSAGLAMAVDGVSDERILLGQSAALSGPAEALGREMQLGARLAFDAANAAGGVHGRKIELRALDDGYEPERAAANTRKLIEGERVFALFGYVGTPTTEAARKAVNRLICSQGRRFLTTKLILDKARSSLLAPTMVIISTLDSSRTASIRAS